ncbi:MAG TPA: hypothetical protein DIW44_10000 [Anaerolineaceae bacterium]|nr:hypothetical protein [Anaerolineaceae bacterium]
MKIRLLIFIFVLSFLCSCRTENDTIQTTNTPKSIVPSLTSTVTSTPHSLIISPTVTATLWYLATPTYSDRLSTQTADFPTVCQNIRSFSISNSENWIAINCSESYVQTFEVENKLGKHWTLFLNDYLDKDIVAKYGYFHWGGFSTHNWSKEDNYLLFSTYDGIDYGGTCYYGPRIGVLYKLDLNSGEVVPFLLNSQGDAAYFYDISPDRNMFIYYDKGPIIYNLLTGEKTKIPYDIEAGIGEFTWSSDDKQLAFSTCQPDENDFVIKSTIEIFSLETNIIKQILSIEGEFLNIVYSEDNSLLEIKSSYEEYSYYYDWAIAKFVKAPKKK